MSTQDEQLLIDYINGELEETECLFVQTKIELNEEWRSNYDFLVKMKGTFNQSYSQEFPSSESAMKFDNFIGKLENSNSSRLRNLSRFWIKRAAVILGFAICGFWILSEQSKFQNTTNQQLALFKSLIGKTQTTDKIEGVHVAYNIGNGNQEVISILTELLYFDESDAVKIACIRGLMDLAPENISNNLIKALKTEKSPSIQISLINALIELSNSDFIDQIESIENDNQFSQVVLDELESLKFELDKI